MNDKTADLTKVNSDLKLFLFTTDINFAQEAERSGVNSIIVDWEHKGKEERQKSYDTEVNFDTAEDVLSLSKNLKIPVTVRINSLGEHSAEEIAIALDNGAKIIMLPMARQVSEVEEFIRLIDGRAETLVQLLNVVDLAGLSRSLSGI